MRRFGQLSVLMLVHVHVHVFGGFIMALHTQVWVTLHLCLWCGSAVELHMCWTLELHGSGIGSGATHESANHIGISPFGGLSSGVYSWRPLLKA